MNKRIIKSNDEGGGVVPTSFNTVLYTGTNASQDISVGFTPDLVWIKGRTYSDFHALTDSVRGNKKWIGSNVTNSEFDYSSFPSGISFIEGGFNNDGPDDSFIFNKIGEDYVAWCWKAGGAAVTNTDGTITSQVSANVDAGFSIVSWTGVGAHTIGHGLGVKPDVVIIKKRSLTGVWITYHVGVDSTNPQDYFLKLNDTAARQYYPQIFPTTFDSNIFSLYDSVTSQDYIAYCFAEVAGFSKFGSYVGTGVAGNFVSTSVDGDAGFEPAFVMIKKTNTSTGNWNIFDNKRGNGDYILAANTSNAEDTTINPLDFNSNGFTINLAFDFINVSGGSYIYMAFANQF